MSRYRDAAGEGLATFAEAMRSVLRTRHDSTVHGPDALETRDLVDGYVWRWSTRAGQWRVTVGTLMDPRPLVHGPGGLWRVDAPPSEAGARLVLLMLRVAGAIPPPAQPRVMPCCSADVTTAYTQGHGMVCRGCGTAYLPPVTGEIDGPAVIRRPDQQHGAPVPEYRSPQSANFPRIAVPPATPTARQRFTTYQGERRGVA